MPIRKNRTGYIRLFFSYGLEFEDVSNLRKDREEVHQFCFLVGDSVSVGVWLSRNGHGEGIFSIIHIIYRKYPLVFPSSVLGFSGCMSSRQIQTVKVLQPIVIAGGELAYVESVKSVASDRQGNGSPGGISKESAECPAIGGVISGGKIDGIAAVVVGEESFPLINAFYRARGFRPGIA